MHPPYTGCRGAAWRRVRVWSKAYPYHMLPGEQGSSRGQGREVGDNPSRAGAEGSSLGRGRKVAHSLGRGREAAHSLGNAAAAAAQEPWC